MRMQTAWWSMAMCAAVVLLGAPGVLQAEDEEAEAQPPVLSMRLYGVGALTNGRLSFGSSFPAVQPPDWLTQASRADRQDPWYPLGQVDELIELVKSQVDPAFWEMTDGVDIRSMGEGWLVVRASDAVHLQLARYLASLERRLLRTVVVDVQAVRLTPKALSDLLGKGSGSRLDRQTVDRLLASDARGPAARLTVENRTRGEAFGGAQHAYLRRHQAVSAGGGGATVPVAGVTNAGFAVSVAPVVHAEGRSVRLQLDVSWSQKDGRPALRTAKQEVVELPAAPTLDISTDVILAPGVWGLAHAVTDGWSLLVRAQPGAGLGLSRTARGIAIGSDVPDGEGPYEIRNFDVASLATWMEMTLGSTLVGYLYDTSNDGPPVPAEMGSGSRFLGAETLVELLRHSIGHERIWEDPATIEARNGILIVRNRKPVLDSVARVLDTLRRETPAVFSTRVELVEVDATLRRRLLWAAVESSAPTEALVGKSRALLENAIREGTAERIGGGVLTSIHGMRNVLRSGRRVTYLSTYKPVHKTDGIVIEPVTATALSGLEVELVASLTPGGRAVQLEARCMRTRLVEPVRRVASVHGEIELPQLATLSLRASLTAPLGHTVVAGVMPLGSSGEREVLLLLTPQRQTRDR